MSQAVSGLPDPSGGTDKESREETDSQANNSGSDDKDSGPTSAAPDSKYLSQTSKASHSISKSNKKSTNKKKR